MNWLPSDALLWGSDLPVRPKSRGGRPPVPGVLTMITRLGKNQPSTMLRLRWPWFEEVAGWGMGTRLCLGIIYDVWEGMPVWVGWLAPARPGEKGRALRPRTSRGRDGRVIFPLREEAPYLPRAVPMTDMDIIAEGGDLIVSFVVARGPHVTVGDVLAGKLCGLKEMPS